MKSKRLIALEATSHCWICEGWTEVRFEFRAGTSENIGIDSKTNMFLHLDIDDFEADLMVKDLENSGLYTLNRMVPPGTHNYYFSRGSPHEIIVALDQPSQSLNNVKVPKTNVIENIIRNEVTYTQDLSDNMTAKPRLRREVPAPIKKKLPWRFG